MRRRDHHQPIRKNEEQDLYCDIDRRAGRSKSRTQNASALPPRIQARLTGLLPENRHPVPVSGGTPDRPLSLAWITDELIAETQRVWSPLYDHDLSTDEAVEILRNVKRFAEVLTTVLRDRRET